MMKPVSECSNMQEIRAAIDTIDQQIISQLGERFEYVKAASAFKTSAIDVRAPDRFRSMLEQRRLWAEDSGLNPDAIEKLYRDLVEHFISEEIKEWTKQNG